MVMEVELRDLTQKVEESEAEVRTIQRKLDSVRGLSRIIVENTLSKRVDCETTCNQLENLFFNSYEK